MEMLFSLPAIVKIAAIFVLIIALGKTRLPFGAALFVAVLCTGLWFKMGAAATIWIALQNAFSAESLLLVLMMALILFFSGMLEKAGQLRQIVDSFGYVIKSTKIKLVAMPALIGLLPMPGGALFSAPMVEAAIPDSCVRPEQKTNINYYFRHIWEFWWPLYPGMIIFLSLTRVDILQVVAINIPLSVTMTAIGYFFFLRGRIFDRVVLKQKDKRIFLRKVFPLILVFATLFIYMGISKVLEKTAGIRLPLKTYLPIYVGLGAGIIYCLRNHTYSGRDLLGLVFGRKNLDLWVMIMGIIAFKAVMEQSGAVQSLRGDLVRYHLPVRGVIFALPFLSGLIFGVMFGTIGASFPLILPLVQSAVSATTLTYMGAYMAGFIGMMLSPIHACLLLTRKHFDASLAKAIRGLLLPFLLYALIAAAYYLALAKIGVG